MEAVACCGQLISLAATFKVEEDLPRWQHEAGGRDAESRRRDAVAAHRERAWDRLARHERPVRRELHARLLGCDRLLRVLGLLRPVLRRRLAGWVARALLPRGEVRGGDALHAVDLNVERVASGERILDPVSVGQRQQGSSEGAQFRMTVARLSPSSRYAAGYRL